VLQAAIAEVVADFEATIAGSSTGSAHWKNVSESLNNRPPRRCRRF
jgi:hypothetical protein